MEKAAESSPGEGVFQARHGSPTAAREDPPPAFPSPPSVALLGSVFDPPHNGHLAMAEAALRALPLEQVTFLIAGSPPNKRKPAASRKQRLAMLRAALANRPEFRIDARELERPGPTYLIDTLRQLQSDKPSAVIYFLVGIDAARHMHKWRCVEGIFQICRPVPFARPGFGGELRAQDVPFLSDSARNDLNERLIREPCLPVSSTEIRRRIAADGNVADVRGMLPTAVIEVIEAERIYSCGEE